MSKPTVKRQLPELLASLGDSGTTSQHLPLSHSICCKLCLSILKQAKILPCLHSFCYDCLMLYIRKSTNNLKDRKLLCPTCQEYHKLPGNGIKGLLNNTLIEQSISKNVPKLALRKKQEPLFPGLYSSSEDSYEVLVKPPDQSHDQQDDVYDDQSESSKWQSFMERQKTSEDDLYDQKEATNKKQLNISEALKGLSNEERLEKLTNSLKNTFSFSQALQDHELKLENDIRALRSSSSSSEYSFTNRDFLHEQLSYLQTEAMNIIYRLDGVDTSVDTWERSRDRIETQVQTQVDKIINAVRQVERKLINQIDNYTEHNKPLNPVKESKKQLQSLLRNLLGVIDFIRLILNNGSNREIEMFEQLVADRCHHLLCNTISVDKTDIAFTPGEVLEKELEKLVGDLSFSTTTEEIWKFNEETSADNVIPSDSVFCDTAAELQRKLPPCFSKEFLDQQMSASGHGQTFTPDSLADDQEPQKLTVDQLIHKFSTEFGMRYHEILPDDSSSTPMTTSLTSSENPLPSPIQEEANENGFETDILTVHSRYRPRSHRRRHSVSDVYQDLAHARIDLSDNRYRGLTRSRKSSVPDTMTRSSGERPLLSNDLEQTKRILALCKRQLLEAKSMGIYSSNSGSPSHSSMSSPEHRPSRSTSMTHEHIQRIRTKYGIERTRSPSAGSVQEY